jgi:hypothetical protein
VVLVALVPIDFAGCCPSVCVSWPYPRTWLDSFGDVRSATIFSAPCTVDWPWIGAF